MREEARGTMITWLCQRWVKHTRYYEVLHRDLWRDWIVSRIGGRRSSPLGRVQHCPCEFYAEGLRQVQQRCTRRGYALVGNDSLNILQGDGFESRR